MTGAHPSRDEILLASTAEKDGTRRIELSVPGIHCAGCMRRIEQGLQALDGIVSARVNLTAKRVTMRWRGDPPPVLEALEKLGFAAHLVGEPNNSDKTRTELIRALAVAGFSAANIMALSVAVWSGAAGEARDLFHWLSALIAAPALLYSGRIFYRSAWQALRHGRSNMDVPISIGVLLAYAMSLYDTIHHGAHAYFDASATLLFFLLIGRTLDHVMREKARNAVEGLARLASRGAMVEHDDGSRSYLPVEQITPGLTVLLAPGERVPVDGRVISGASDLDCSLVTGETVPRPVAAGEDVAAGTMNLTGPLRLRATASAKEFFLAQVLDLMHAAEAGRSVYRRIADRAASLYAPVVHLAALLSLAGWLVATGDLHLAVTIAVAVLIITCPCALGLAVPMVQVMATRHLFEQGIMVKDGGALERLAQADHVIFDKTGTLTLGRPVLRNRHRYSPADLACAAALARNSRHPYARAIAEAAAGIVAADIPLDSITEIPGHGVEANTNIGRFRLGRADWALDDPAGLAENGIPGTILSRDGALVASFSFDDPLRPGAGKAIAQLLREDIAVEILSGDHPAIVAKTAAELGVEHFAAGALPQDKIARLQSLAAEGRNAVMVGDGLNDAPALAAAFVSMAPSSAADMGRNRGDFVFFRDTLQTVTAAISVARRARTLIHQNFALAIVYNVLALPLAVSGMVTPLIAALAMSCSSVIVVANSMRLGQGEKKRQSHTRPSVAATRLPAMEGIR